MVHKVNNDPGSLGKSAEQEVNRYMALFRLRVSDKGKNQDQHQELGDLKGTHDGCIEYVTTHHVSGGEKHHREQRHSSYPGQQRADDAHFSPRSLKIHAAGPFSNVAGFFGVVVRGGESEANPPLSQVAQLP